MNYYQHHIGDFNNATRCLTRVERSVYRDLIELYYDKEEPLTANIKILQKLVLVSSDEEIEALNTVLEMFFTCSDDQYRNGRCDAEIEKYQSNQSAKAKAGRASAAKRKRNSTPVEQPNNECATNQEPITSNQEPIKKNSNQVGINPDLLASISESWNSIMGDTQPKISLTDKTQINKKRMAKIKKILADHPNYKDHEYWEGHISYLATLPELQWQRDNKQLTFDQAVQLEKFERNLGLMKMGAGQ